jgi:GxxExxY protein
MKGLQRASVRRDPRTYAIIGAAMDVHKTLGFGFLEAVYHEALLAEMNLRQIPFEHEVELPIIYKNQKLTTTYRADFVCYEKIVVELKALNNLTGKEESQIINYLKASNHELGLLINFGHYSLEYKRYIHSQDTTKLARVD